MNDYYLLDKLSQLYSKQADVAVLMAWAIFYCNRKSDRDCWHMLLSWCLARDERDEIWKGIEDQYFDAVMLREGYQ